MSCLRRGRLYSVFTVGRRERGRGICNAIKTNKKEENNKGDGDARRKEEEICKKELRQKKR